jgi:Protein of unknown function (DUF4232)
MRRPDLRPLAVLATAFGFFALGGALAAAAEPQPAASPGAAARAVTACAPSDLTLREVSATAGALPSAVYALRNGGSAACRIAGEVGIRMLDAHGATLRLRFGPNSMMPVLLTLAAGDEASFTVTYGRAGTAQCGTAARVEVYLPPNTTPVGAPTTFTACALPSVRVSALRLGVPAAPSPSPAPTPPPAPSPSPSAPPMARLVT